MTLTIRLDTKLETALTRVAARSGLSKSQIVKDSLREHLANLTLPRTPYELGKELFGKKPGSGEGDLSDKARIRSRINERIRAENYR